MGRNARLIARRVAVVGGVEATGAKKIAIASSRVGGTVNLNGVKLATVTLSRIGGDLRYHSGNGGARAARNRVGGSIEALANVGRVVVLGNVVGANLTCAQNKPGVRPVPPDVLLVLLAPPAIRVRRGRSLSYPHHPHLPPHPPSGPAVTVSTAPSSFTMTDALSRSGSWSSPHSGQYVGNRGFTHRHEAA